MPTPANLYLLCIDLHLLYNYSFGVYVIDRFILLSKLL